MKLKKLLSRTSTPKINIITLIKLSAVIKKEQTNIKANAIKLNIIFRETRDEKSFSLLGSLANSLVRILNIPKSEKMMNILTKDRAKLNFPYPVAPRILAM